MGDCWKGGWRHRVLRAGIGHDAFIMNELPGMKENFALQYQE